MLVAEGFGSDWWNGNCFVKTCLHEQRYTMEFNFDRYLSSETSNDFISTMTIEPDRSFRITIIVDNYTMLSCCYLFNFRAWFVQVLRRQALSQSQWSLRRYRIRCKCFCIQLCFDIVSWPWFDGFISNLIIERLIWNYKKKSCDWSQWHS